jgi:hypothetical protein
VDLIDSIAVLFLNFVHQVLVVELVRFGVGLDTIGKSLHLNDGLFVLIHPKVGSLFPPERPVD